MAYKKIPDYEDIIDINNIDKFKRGELYDSYNFLGSHKSRYKGKIGICFNVWAPNAKNVYLVGDFNDWNKEAYPMENIEGSGIWTIFLTNAKQGQAYKYNVIGCDGVSRMKSDPYAVFSEKRPNTASIIYTNDNYKWNDRKWQREKQKIVHDNSPMNIYEVHLGSWKRKWDGEFFSYEELYEMIEYVKDMGYTHIELMPITEHPLDESWGYQTIGYYSSTSRYGTPTEFKAFIDKCHENGIGVILDFAYSHFCKDAHGLYKFDGSAQFEYSDPLKAENIGWGTAHFDLGKPEVNSFLISNVLYWFNEYHIDGIRVDAVSSMLYLDYDIGEWRPNKYGGRENLEAIDFLKRLNKIVYTTVNNPIIIAEESTAWPMVTGPTYSGALGFTYKWNMGWMHDFLDYMKLDPYFRKDNHNKMTFGMSYATSEKFILVLSHDEVVHLKCSMINKMPGLLEDKFKNLKAGYLFMFGHAGKKLLFMGQDFGQAHEWNEKVQLDWWECDNPLNKDLQDFVRDLLHIYKKFPAMYALDDSWDGFEWVNADDRERSIFSFIRKDSTEKNALLFVINFTPVERDDYMVGVPNAGTYSLVLNEHGLVTEKKSLRAKKGECDGKKYHISYPLPAYGCAVFKFNYNK